MSRGTVTTVREAEVRHTRGSGSGRTEGGYIQLAIVERWRSSRLGVAAGVIHFGTAKENQFCRTCWEMRCVRADDGGEVRYGGD